MLQQALLLADAANPGSQDLGLIPCWTDSLPCWDGSCQDKSHVLCLLYQCQFSQFIVQGWCKCLPVLFVHWFIKQYSRSCVWGNKWVLFIIAVQGSIAHSWAQVQVGHYSESSESAFAVAAPEEKAFLRVCLYQATNELCILQLDFTVLFIITYDK